MRARATTIPLKIARLARPVRRLARPVRRIICPASVIRFVTKRHAQHEDELPDKLRVYRAVIRQRLFAGGFQDIFARD
jgi:hypothetical protein